MDWQEEMKEERGFMTMEGVENLRRVLRDKAEVLADKMDSNGRVFVRIARYAQPARSIRKAIKETFE